MGGFGQILKNMFTQPVPGTEMWSNIQRSNVAKGQLDIEKAQEERAQHEADLQFHQHMIESGAVPVVDGMVKEEQPIHPMVTQMLGDAGVMAPPGGTATVIRKADPANVIKHKDATGDTAAYELPSVGSQHWRAVMQARAEAQGQAQQELSRGQTAGTAAGTAESLPALTEAQIQQYRQQIGARGVPVPADVAQTLGYPEGSKALLENLPGLQQEAAKIRALNRLVLKPGESALDLTPQAGAAPGTPGTPGTAAPGQAPVIGGAKKMTDAETQSAIDAAVPDKKSDLYKSTSNLVRMWRNQNNDPEALKVIDRAREEAAAPGKAAAIEAAKTPEEVNRAKLQEIATTPYKVAQQVATARALRAGDNPAVANVAPAAIPQVQTAAMKLDADQLKANASVEALGRVLDLADKGNKAAGANVSLVGVGALNAVNSIKRINSAEISQYGSAGSLLDKIQGKLGKWTSGKPIPQDVLDDIRALHQDLGTQSYQNYTDGLNALNTRTGSKFTPAATPPNIRKLIQVTDPTGAVHTFRDQASADKFKELAHIK